MKKFLCLLLTLGMLVGCSSEPGSKFDEVIKDKDDVEALNALFDYNNETITYVEGTSVMVTGDQEYNNRSVFFKEGENYISEQISITPEIFQMSVYGAEDGEGGSLFAINFENADAPAT